jgi:hypothetical protein
VVFNGGAKVGFFAKKLHKICCCKGFEGHVADQIKVKLNSLKTSVL